jgi:hypothetical protein
VAEAIVFGMLQGFNVDLQVDDKVNGADPISSVALVAVLWYGALLRSASSLKPHR